MTNDLTFAELRRASKSSKAPGRAMAMAELAELAQTVVPSNMLERFMDGESIEAHTRLIRQGRGLGLITQILVDMMIQIDRFADMNHIDLAAAIRQRLETLTEDKSGDPQHGDVERQRSGD